jgi:hypothetical protein
MMNHEHFPALKKYTSQVQYDALKSIENTKSIKDLVFSGSSSRTLGALVRCAWINTFPYVEDGMKHEGWCVTDEGKHAMTMYEERVRLEQAKADEFKVHVDKYSELIMAEYELELTHRPEIERLELASKKLVAELWAISKKRESAGWSLTHYQRACALDAVKQNYLKSNNNRSQEHHV